MQTALARACNSAACVPPRSVKSLLATGREHCPLSVLISVPMNVVELGLGRFGPSLLFASQNARRERRKTRNMSHISLDLLQQRMQRFDRIPSVPAILFPLIRCVEQPIERIDVQKVVDLISHDKSLAAQCLHMANSPLFGRWHNIDNLRGAVVALGVARVRDIAMSCCVLKLLPDQASCIDPRVFWEHSLGVALVSRRLARCIAFRDPEKAYLAGLLHDIGIVLNLLLIPDEFREATSRAYSDKIPIADAEKDVLGITHGVTGGLLADHWHLSGDLREVVRRHHDLERASLYRGLAALVNVADLICRSCGLGYGFNEAKPISILDAPAWDVLAQECPLVKMSGAARCVSEMDMYAVEVRKLVGVLFHFEHH